MISKHGIKVLGYQGGSHSVGDFRFCAWPAAPTARKDSIVQCPGAVQAGSGVPEYRIFIIGAYI